MKVRVPPSTVFSLKANAVTITFDTTQHAAEFRSFLIRLVTEPGDKVVRASLESKYESKQNHLAV